MTAVEWLQDELETEIRCGSGLKELDKNVFDALIEKAKEIEQEQHQYTWDKCKKIVHEGFVYVRYNDLLECEKSFNNCT
jgi:hypothetical protein